MLAYSLNSAKSFRLFCRKTYIPVYKKYWIGIKRCSDREYILRVAHIVEKTPSFISPDSGKRVCEASQRWWKEKDKIQEYEKEHGENFKFQMDTTTRGRIRVGSWMITVKFGSAISTVCCLLIEFHPLSCSIHVLLLQCVQAIQTILYRQSTTHSISISFSSLENATWENYCSKREQILPVYLFTNPSLPAGWTRIRE